MGRGLAVFVCIAMCALSVTGCATTRRRGPDTSQVEQLRNEITMLEIELQDRNEQLNNLRDELTMEQRRQRVSVPAAAPAVKKPGKFLKPDTKDIQMALLSAGFNPGIIDGKMGKKTRRAVRAFQKANGLKVDGKVGPRTWAVLGPYLKLK
ncbi:MAG: peptidoglycan-binding protein [Candidatus Omnitrophica bacterium]|nr:peptidoglycan-binding protein [Candidatus Omnitrophota bacterium]